MIKNLAGVLFMKDLIIIGAGGFGREVSWLVERINQKKQEWNLLGFVDDSEALQSKTVDGYKVLGGSDTICNYPDSYVVCCIANTSVRRALVKKAEAFGNPFATLVDPGAVVSDKVEIGVGSVICAGAVITVDIKIGRHNIIDVNSTIGHDAVLCDFVTLYPSVNVSGNTLIKSGVELGTGTQVIQGLTVGEGTVVGAGAVVVRDLPDSCTAVGVPAKVIKRHEQKC